MSNFISTTPTLNLPFNRQKTPEDMNSLLKRVGATYTRGGDSGSATYVNSKGLIEVVPDGLPRPDFDPVTKQNKGLHIEEGRENYAKYSEDLSNPHWIKGNSTVSLSTENKIKNGSIYKIEEDSANGGHEVRSTTVSVGSPGVFVVISALVKADERNIFSLDGYSSSLWELSTRPRGVFDLSSEDVLEELFCTADIEYWGDGYYRCWISAQLESANSDVSVRMSLWENADTISYTGITGSGLYATAVQIEEGTSPSSYIPTGSSSVTRTADTPYIEDAGGETPFSDFYNQEEGTFVVESSLNGITDFDENRFNFQVDDGSNNNRLLNYYRSGDNDNSFAVVDSGSFSEIRDSVQTLNSTKQSTSYSDGDQKFIMNGALIGSTSVTIPTSLTQLSIGWRKPTNNLFLNGHIARLIYFPVALSDLEQIKLTRNL